MNSSTEEAEKTIAEDIVVTKYSAAGDIVNRESELSDPASCVLVADSSVHVCRFP
jgi:hypothetical protein